MLIGYMRVSTQDQNLALQRDALREAGCDKFFEETASGAAEGVDRPQLKAALDYTRDGDTLVVWRLDRLARSVKQLIGTVEEMERRGVGLRSLNEAIDTTTAGGKLVFHIFGALAEFERSLIRERTKAGLRAAQRHGRRPGRRKALKEQDRAVALALLKDISIPVEEVAKRVGVSLSVLYREFPGGRSVVLSEGN